MSPSLELRGVSKSDGCGRLRKTVVSDCSFSLEKDAFTVMIGPSGGGKSTLVRLIASFERPRRGVDHARRSARARAEPGASGHVSGVRVVPLDDDAAKRRVWLMLEYYAGVYEASPRTNLFVTTDIDEAMLLADRLLIMTHVPMRVAAVIEVNSPRPRALGSLSGDDRAGAIKARALGLLRAEGLKAFGHAHGSVNAGRGRPLAR